MQIMIDYTSAIQVACMIGRYLCMYIIIYQLTLYTIRKTKLSLQFCYCACMRHSFEILKLSFSNITMVMRLGVNPNMPQVRVHDSTNTYLLANMIYVVGVLSQVSWFQLYLNKPEILRPSVIPIFLIFNSLIWILIIFFKLTFYTRYQSHK